MTLQQARKFALSLPQTTEEPHFESSPFRVRGRIFATVPPSGTHLHIFVEEEQRIPLIAAQPEVFEARTGVPRWSAYGLRWRNGCANGQSPAGSKLVAKGAKRLAASYDLGSLGKS